MPKVAPAAFVSTTSFSAAPVVTVTGWESVIDPDVNVSVYEPTRAVRPKLEKVATP